MRYIFGACLLTLVGVVGWRIGQELSPDAIGMAIGLLFGIMAGTPAALMVLASRRREDMRHDRRPEPQRPRSVHITVEHFDQPPVVVRPGRTEAKPETWRVVPQIDGPTADAQIPEYQKERRRERREQAKRRVEPEYVRLRNAQNQKGRNR